MKSNKNKYNRICPLCGESLEKQIRVTDRMPKRFKGKEKGNKITKIKVSGVKVTFEEKRQDNASFTYSVYYCAKCCIGWNFRDTLKGAEKERKKSTPARTVKEFLKLNNLF